MAVQKVCSQGHAGVLIFEAVHGSFRTEFDPGARCVISIYFFLYLRLHVQVSQDSCKNLIL